MGIAIFIAGLSATEVGFFFYMLIQESACASSFRTANSNTDSLKRSMIGQSLLSRDFVKPEDGAKRRRRNVSSQTNYNILKSIINKKVILFYSKTPKTCCLP